MDSRSFVDMQQTDNMHMWTMGEGPYWHLRYSQEKFRDIDWYCSYDVMKKHGLFDFTPADLRPESRILMLGCGNSSLSVDMYMDGFEHITNIDISTVVIDQMRTIHAAHGMDWIAVDAGDMSIFEDQQFDFVIDKGTMDAVCCGASAAKNALAVCAEVRRVLKVGGVYMCMSYAPPYLREQYLTRGNPCWELNIQTIVLEPQETTKCLSVLEGESPQFYVYYLTRTEHPVVHASSVERSEGVVTFLENPAFVGKSITHPC